MQKMCRLYFPDYTSTIIKSFDIEETLAHALLILLKHLYGSRYSIHWTIIEVSVKKVQSSALMLQVDNQEAHLADLFKTLKI